MKTSGDTKIELIDMGHPKGIFFYPSSPPYQEIRVRATGTVNENGEVDIEKVLSYDIINKSKNK